MRLEQLLYLIEVINLKNMHTASSKLYTSVQNISKSIKSLERELGVPLIYRTKHGFEPTGDGKIVYEKAIAIRDILDQLNELYFPQNLSNYPKENKNCISIASVCSLTIRIDYIIKQIKASQPDITFSFCEYEGSFLDRILNPNSPSISDFDFFFLAYGSKALSANIEKLKDFDVYVLCTDQLGLTLNKKHPLAIEKTLPISVLNTISLASFQVSFSDTPFYAQVLKENNFSLINKPKYVSNLHHVCEDYVDQNKAAMVTCVPSNGKENYSLAKTKRIAIPFKEQIEITHLMAYPKNRALSANEQLFKQAVLEFFSNSYYRYMP